MSKPAEIDNSQQCVSIFCVMPQNLTEATCPKDLFRAFKWCQENGFNIRWKSEEDGLKMTPNKEDLFILAEFSGKIFTYLRNLKCKIIGPQCLLVSVEKNDPLPDVDFPVFNLAMKGLVVTSTSCNCQEKKDIQEKVEFMGGVYTAGLSGKVTHLVIKSVAGCSSKFKAAVSKDLPIMVTSWIDAVWAQSCKESVHGTDPVFVKFACPPFLGLQFCVTQIPFKEREILRKIIENNGGHYSGQLEINKTHILIARAAEGEKYNYAKRWKIRCLKPDWIHHSLNKGYALIDTDNYIVDSSTVPPRSSTPESNCTMRFGNTSMNSTIMNESHIKQVSHVNDTVGSSIIYDAPTATAANNLWKEAVDAIDSSLSKKAGSFLDGCKILVSGFGGGPLEEKLSRQINNAGVARFNSESESIITHVIAGQRDDEHWKQLEQLGRKPHVVTADCVVQSLRMQQAAPESRYLRTDYKITQRDLLKNLEKPTIVSTSVTKGEESKRKELFDPFTSLRTSKKIRYFNDSSDLEDSHIEEVKEANGIFAGLNFQFSKEMNSDLAQEISDKIFKNGGSLNAKKANYLLIEVGCQYVTPGAKSQVVNTLWIDECIEKDAIVEIEAYHRQIIVKDRKRMENYTVSLTGIPMRLKLFIFRLIRLMGGKHQETFSRKDLESRGICKSTHLVCLNAAGPKYIKAKEWCVPAVDIQWIIDSAISEDRPNEANYHPGCSGGKLMLENTPAHSARRRKAEESTPLGTQRLPLNEVVPPKIARMDPSTSILSNEKEMLQKLCHQLSEEAGTSTDEKLDVIGFQIKKIGFGSCSSSDN